MQRLSLLVALALIGSTHAQAVVREAPSTYTASTGKISLSGGPALILPPWFFPSPGLAGGDEAPGGVAVAQVLDNNGAPICSGVLIAPTMVLTAGECAEEAVDVVVGGVRFLAVDVVVGGERFMVVEGVQHPVAAGMRESLAVLRLAGMSRLAPGSYAEGIHDGRP
ncbi:hypothetical protein T484DRAFT_1807626 [Baffinella frigidus]|nr:hypothetical protein T484DRAFT_1807626 [Cryptophyta sp. CCMP2293]